MPKFPETESQPHRQFVKLEFKPRAKLSLAAVFNEGHFRPPINAIQEIVHNAADWRNKGAIPSTAIVISLKDDELSVLSVNEVGMGPDGLQKVVSIGTSDERGVGIGGLGAAAAGSAIGNDALIRGQLAGENVRWTMEVRGFGDPRVEWQGDVAVDPQVVDNTVGMAEVTLKNLKIATQDIPASEIKRDFGRAFRTLLAPADIETEPVIRASTKDPSKQIIAPTQILPPRKIVDANGNITNARDRISMFVYKQKRTERVYPQPKPLKQGYTENLRVAWTGENEGEGVALGYWAGEVDRSTPEGKKVDRGFDVILDGRLIHIEGRRGKLFGHDLNQAGLQDITGELHVDNIPDIKLALTYNKAAGIAQQSTPWQLVSQTMNRELKPLVDQLTSKPTEIDPRLPSVMEDAIGTARKLADAVIGQMFAGDEFIQEYLGLTATIPVQTPPTHTRKKVPTLPSEPLGIRGADWKDQNPTTLPTADASENYPRKRKSFASGIRYRGFGPNSPQKSVLVVEKQGGSIENRSVEINTDHPQFQTVTELGRKDPDLGRVELVTYLSEELVGHMAKILAEDSLTDFERHRDDGVYRLWETLRRSGMLATISVRPDAEIKTKKKKR